MAIDNVVASLSRMPIFAGLKPLQIKRIARRAEHCWFRCGDVITRAGTPGDGAFLILSGNALGRPRQGSHAPSEPIAPGSLVGELAMLVEHTYGATVVADGPVYCLKLVRATLHAQMRADPEIAERFARVIRERLRLTASELRSINQFLAESVPLARVGAAKPPLMLPDAIRTLGYGQ
jgi:CRP-like cAMP-binding protein